MSWSNPPSRAEEPLNVIGIFAVITSLTILLGLFLICPSLRADRCARGPNENPIKVGVITNATLNLESRFLNVGPARVMIFTTSQTSPAQIEKPRGRGAQVSTLRHSFSVARLRPLLRMAMA